MWRQRKTKDLFSTSHQQVKSRHFLGSRASACLAVSLENTFRNNKYVCVLPFLLAFIARQTSYGIEHPFGHLRLDVPVVCPLQILTSPSLLPMGGMLETAFVLCKHSSAAAKTPFYQRTALGELLWGKLPPSQADSTCLYRPVQKKVKIYKNSLCKIYFFWSRFSVDPF